jgi:hypothetical protein
MGDANHIDAVSAQGLTEAKSMRKVGAQELRSLIEIPHLGRRTIGSRDRSRQ